MKGLFLDWECKKRNRKREKKGDQRNNLYRKEGEQIGWWDEAGEGSTEEIDS